jgi:hypothetical protein
MDAFLYSLFECGGEGWIGFKQDCGGLHKCKDGGFGGSDYCV